MSQAKSVIQTMENTNMHLLVLFGMASCLLTALKGLPLNLGSISLEGGRPSTSQLQAAQERVCPRPPCTPTQSSCRTRARSLLPVAFLPLGFTFQQETEHESRIVFALGPISFADGIQECRFVL